MIKVQVSINGVPTMILRDLLETDETGREYDHYLLDKVDGLYQPDLDVIESEELESLKSSKRSERDEYLRKADIEINKLLDSGEDYSEWSLYRQELRDFTEISKWYEKDIPSTPS
jgi:hypothetical protein